MALRKLHITTVAAAVAVLALPAQPAFTSTSHAATIDFEGVGTGTVSTLSAGSGISIDAGAGHIDGSVSVRGVNPKLGGNQAMVFDATCPPGGTPEDCSGKDYDLFKPELGKILIVSEDGDSSDPDDVDVRGSKLVFDFSGLGPGVVDVDSLLLFDIEVEETEPNPRIETWRGDTQVTAQNERETGDNAYRRVQIGAEGVDRLVVILNGSGAIDSVRITIDHDEPDPELAIAKRADPPSGSTVEAGGTITYSVDVTETTGLAAFPNASFRDTLTGDATITAIDGCDNAPAAGGQDFTCELGTVAAGATETVTVTAQVSPDQPDCAVENVATLSVDDRTPGDNTSQVIRHACEPPVNIALEKTTQVPPGTVLFEGDDVTYTIAVTETLGFLAAENVVVRDVYTGPGSITGTDCGNGTETGTGECTFASIAAGSTETFDVTVTVGPTAGDVCSNIATTEFEDDDPDDNTTPPVDRDCGKPGDPDLEVTKRTIGAPVTLDDGATRIDYAVSIANVGDQDARGIELEDVVTSDADVPLRLTVTDAGGGLCPPATQARTEAFCERDLLAAGATWTVTMSVTAELGADACSTITNVAESSTATLEGDTANNRAVVAVGPVGPGCDPEPEIAVRKSAQPPAGASLFNGDAIFYTVEVEETSGVADATDVLVLDEYSGSGSIEGIDCGNGTLEGTGCRFATIAAGTTETFQVTVVVGEDEDHCVNVARTDFVDRDPSNNTSERVRHDCSPAGEVDLRVTKTRNSSGVVEVGADGVATIAYTVTVENLGDEPALEVTLTDDVTSDHAAGLRLTATDTGDGACPPATRTSLSSIECQIESLAGGASWTVAMSVEVTIEDEGCIEVTNTAATATTSVEPNTANNTSAVTVDVQNALCVDTGSASTLLLGVAAGLLAYGYVLTDVTRGRREEDPIG